MITKEEAEESSVTVEDAKKVLKQSAFLALASCLSKQISQQVVTEYGDSVNSQNEFFFRPM